MKLVPLFKCQDLKRALAFYTNVLDFKLSTGDSPDDFVVTVTQGDTELMLTRVEGDQRPAINACVYVANVDTLFKKFKSRGLATDKPDSPVHQGPVDQTWGTREFYVTDPDGNTLRFIQRR